MKQLSIATESIAFQTGAFFKELVMLINDARANNSKNKDSDQKFCTLVDQCIYKFTGISTLAKMATLGDNAFVMVPAMTRGNVLNSAEFNDYLKENFDAEGMSFYNLEKKGWIDPANSKVGGAFSEIVYRMYLGTVFLDEKKFSPEEFAAVILHEVGHAYTFLQFIADTVVTNIVLQRTYQELTNGNADKKVKYILTKAADDMQIKNRDWLSQVEDKTDKDVAIKILATAVAIEERGMDNKRFFTMDTAEELADIFAARHGAGRYIVTLRSKFNYQSPSYPILQGLGWSIAGAGLLALVAAIPVLGGVVLAYGILVTMISLTAASVEQNMSDFKHLAAKMRNQLVEQIKQSKLPPEEAREILENLAAVDQTIQSYNSAPPDPSLLAQFFDMFRRGKMDARASREYTDRLERLASNDLFVRAAQLGAAADAKK